MVEYDFADGWVIDRLAITIVGHECRCKAEAHRGVKSVVQCQRMRGCHCYQIYVSLVYQDVKLLISVTPNHEKQED